MIISASRRTDVPAFYADWFMTRVREGFFHRVNPFNSNQVSGFSLKPEHVDAICFWTKNPRPLMKHLDELDEIGLKYYFQFTLNQYDKIFEPNVPSYEERQATFWELAEHVGSDRIIWRYDPVILSSVTPVEWHIEQINQMAPFMWDSTKQLVFSFYDFYGKGQGRLHAALKQHGITLHDITASERRGDMERLVTAFKSIASAGAHGMRVSSCSEGIDLTELGVEHGACIDGKLIQKLFGGNPSYVKDKNQRLECGCVESVDMGIYNTCHFKCSYCYANFNEAIIENNCLKHYPNSPSLLGQHEEHVEIQTSLHKKKKCGGCQLSLLTD